MKTALKSLVLSGLTWAIITMPGIPVQAAEKAAADTGDTAFIIICAALVLLMTPGLALFYGGMVRKKNVLSIMMQCIAVMALVSVQWVLLGYTLSFGSDQASLIGGLEFLGLQGIGLTPSADFGTTIPHQVFVAFQLMFAIITASLISGAFAERMKFSVFVVFVLLWTTLVYDPLAHWVWGGGWLTKLGALDFAGGTVVHISSGVSGLVAALVLGRRHGREREAILPHSLPLTVLGAALLWFGWFGFNAGSALGANGLAGLAFLVTNTCAAAGALSWVAAEWIDHGKPTVFGAVSGAVAGLVAITPAAGFVSPLSSVIMGLLVGPLCYLAVSRVKEKLGYDDSLDVFGIHGVGGTFGALATGVFASQALNPAGVNGLIYGNTHLIQVQAVAVLATYVFAGLMTYLILKAIGLFTDLRVTAEEEETGLDVSLHGESAYGYSEEGQNTLSLGAV
ncbi:Ammonium transporter [Syntrophomonas zehnderi OL-4]|uniref:Ammonium transporter n=1 Tax=Syntrophomonas zehnderi OL-4 TaxID=690567 RepID=A0A0E4C8N7_9FIRM|nr:ammonium transporter [Syntrophomonas zehnderi]CFX56012.1 Ammonium transporter [Syntrophomonas zehnderi OL-4]